MNEDLQKQIEEATVKMEASVSKTETTEPEVETTPATSEVDEVTQKAIEMGWDPNHKGPSFTSAKEFVERGSFFRKIDSQNKRIDELLSVVKGLDEHNRKVAKSEYDRGLQDAMMKRTEAVAVGDIDAFNRAELDLKTLQAHKPAEIEAKPASNTNNVVTQDMLDFVEDNKSWFNNNTKENARMVKEADGLFVLESQDNPHLSQKDLLKAVKEKIQKLHPEAFENPNKERPATVASGKTSVSSSAKSGLAARLSESQRDFFKKASSAGIKMSIDEYAKQLDASGDLRNE